MRVDYQIWANGELTGTHIADVPKPPEIGSQIQFGESPVLYDVVDVSIDTDYNDDEDESTTRLYVHLRLHLPDLGDVFKPVGHEGPCHDLKIHRVSDDRARDTMTTEAMRTLLTLNVEQLTRTLIFLKSL